MVNKSKVDNYLAPHTLEFDTGVQFTRCMDDTNGLIEIDFKNSLQENEIFSKTLEVDVLVGNYLKLCLAQHNHQHLVTISVDASLANAQCDLYLSTKLAKPYVFLFQNYLQKDLKNLFHLGRALHGNTNLLVMVRTSSVFHHMRLS